MVHKDIVQLSERFRRLELHAAHSGRETLRVLINVLNDCHQDTFSNLVEELQENIRFLLGSLPPYAPPLNAINRVLLVMENALANGAGMEEVRRELGAFQKDAASPRANHEEIARYLLSVLPQHAAIYTHTLSETVLGVLLELHRLEELSMVIVTESRPNNDGWETARRLAERDVKVQLTIDAAMPAAIENTNLMLSGAEVINPDGSVVGKIGAYTAAILCEHYQKPLFVVADSSKFNPIPFHDYHFQKVNPKYLGLGFSSPSLEVTASCFDITPPYLIRAYATEKGLIKASEIQPLISDVKVSDWLVQQMREGSLTSSQIS